LAGPGGLFLCSTEARIGDSTAAPGSGVSSGTGAPVRPLSYRSNHQLVRFLGNATWRSVYKYLAGVVVMLQRDVMPGVLVYARGGLFQRVGL